MVTAHWFAGHLCRIAAGLVVVFALAAAARRACRRDAAFGPGVQLDRRDPQMDQRLSPQAGPGGAARGRARAQRHAGVQGRRNLRTLYRLHRRRARQQSGPRRRSRRQNAVDRSGRPLGAGARHRLFRPVGLEGIAHHLRRSHADAPRHDRQISRRQAADARSDRLSSRQAGHVRQAQGDVRCRQGQQQEGGGARAHSGADRRAVGLLSGDRRICADRKRDQAVAARQRQRQRRQSHHRQRRQVHAGQQRGPRHRTAWRC